MTVKNLISEGYLLIPIYDDLNPYEDLLSYTDNEKVTGLMEKYGPNVGSFIKKSYSKDIATFYKSETEFIVQNIIDEAYDIIKELIFLKDKGIPSRRLLDMQEPITNIPAMQKFGGEVFSLKIKSRLHPWAPIMRCYMLQIGNDVTDSDWILLFGGLKLEYYIKDCPGIVKTLHQRVAEVLNYLQTNDLLT